ncbi:MAG: hypothetical protein EOO06_11715 [Chitinophagaceae bacterium]|nr:MAG: hypothetical protein EOO06_11715 [Chitinophagaceae bacterium]
MRAQRYRKAPKRSSGQPLLQQNSRQVIKPAIVKPMACVFLERLADKNSVGKETGGILFIFPGIFAQ